MVEILINNPSNFPKFRFLEYVFYILVIIRIGTYNYYHQRTSDEFYIALTYFIPLINIIFMAKPYRIIYYVIYLLNISASSDHRKMKYSSSDSSQRAESNG